MTTKRSWKLQEFVGNSSLVTCAALGHKSGRVMATGGENGKVNMWHIGSPNCIMTLSPLPSAVEVIHFNSSEELICGGSRSGALRIWDLAASKVVRQLTGHKAAVRTLDFHPYGDFIVTGAVDHKVRMWDIRRKGCIFTYKGHEGQVNGVEFSPDGRWISSVSDDRTCKIWNITAGKLLHELRDHDAALSCLQFHPNEFLLATGSQDRTSIVYDVEKIQIVSRSPIEANPIQHLMFDDSGKYLYTASQDCCKIYSWEPTCVRLDTELVKWGRPSDITISADQLMGCTFHQNIVSVHIIDTAQLRKTPGGVTEEETKNIPGVRVVPSHPSGASPYVTTRPHTSLGLTSASSPALPKEIHCNNNNSELPFKQIDASDKEKIFKPTSTLSRSPMKKEDQPKHKEELPSKKTPRHSSKVHPTEIHISSSTPNLPAQNSPSTTRVSAPSNSKDPAIVPEKTTEENVFNLQKQLAAVKIKDSPEPLGGALNWSKPNHAQSIDQHIPEKPGVCSTVSPEEEQPTTKSDLPSKRNLELSTVVPSHREDPIGLDMNAFLPAKRDNFPDSAAEKSDADVISSIRKGLDSMRVILTNRYNNLEVVRALWTSGDVMTSINAAVKMGDQALMIDLLNVLSLKPSLWNLDLCVVMLPQIQKLITSKHESYTSVGCSSLKLVLKNFAQVIRSNLRTPPNVVDISREERHQKCKACYSELSEIKAALESKQQTSGKIGSEFRELKILIGTLE